MKSFLLKIVVVVLALAVVTSTADAQRRSKRSARRSGRGAAPAGPEIGGHVGYNFDAEVAFAGAQLAIPVAKQVDFYPSFDWYFTDATTWSLNFDARLRPQVANRNGYLGGGINLTHQTDTQTNVNLFAGVEGRRGNLRPYAEARMILGTASFQIRAG